MSKRTGTKYRGCIVVFRDGGLDFGEAEEIREFIRRGPFGEKVSMVALLETNDEDHLTWKRNTKREGG